MPNELYILISCVLCYMALEEKWPGAQNVGLKIVLSILGPITLVGLFFLAVAHLMGSLDKG